jgi:hypothetical protein
MVLNTNEVLNKFGETLVNEIKFALANKNLTGYGPSVASGDLIKSIRYEVSDGELRIYALNYIGALQYGRKPTVNGNQGGPTLRDRIRIWLDQKGIEPEDGISKESLAYLIARKIHREGTSIYQRTQGQSSGLLDDVINQLFIDNLEKALIFAYVEGVRSEVLKSVPSTMKTNAA